MIGTLGFIFAHVMAFFAIDPIREKFYELFLYAHALFPLPIIFISLHVPYAIYGFIPGILFHLIDKCIRAYQWANSKQATVTRLDNYTMLQIPMPTSHAFKGGEYCFVHIAKVSAIEWHPFSVSGVKDGVVSFHIQAQTKGSWTDNLHTLATTNSALAANIDGPYGSIRFNLASYSNLVFIVGGIGITPFMTLLEALPSNAADSITLHWSMRGMGLYNIFADRLMSLPCVSASNVVLIVNVYDTSAREKEVESGPPATGVNVMRGRPDLLAIITTLKNTSSCLLLCGPKPLVKEAAQLACDSSIDYHEEVFGY
jgi:ferric-chelate reductase